MAQENDASGYHGYRYLLDAVNGRQYAVRFDSGNVKKVDVFAEDSRIAHFKGSEAVYALDDQYTIERRGNDVVISTTAYQIDTDATGKPAEILYAPVEYAVKFKKNPTTNEIFIVYEMMPPSVVALDQAGFNRSFPTNFRDKWDGAAPARINENLVSTFPFPPHHNGQATVAREAFEDKDIGGGIGIGEEEDPWTAAEKKTKTPGTGPATRPSAPFNQRTSEGASSAETPAKRKFKVSDTALESALKQFAADLTAEAAAGRLDPVIGREADTDVAMKVFLRRKQGSICFTGEAGVGKSAMFDAIAQRIVSDDKLPETLKSARLMLLDVQKIVAGTKYRGQFEERVKPLIEGLQERGGVLNGRKIILAIDEIHSAMSSGGAEGGANNFGEMIKSFMQARGISVAGTTTKEEYRKHIEKNPALARRFEKHHLDPTKREETTLIVKGIWPLVRAHHGLTADLTDRDFEYIVTMTDRYAPNEAQPGKSEKVLNLIGASAQFAGRSKVEKEDILAAVSKMSGLSIDFLAKNDGERFLKMREELPKVIFGQPNIQKVISGLIGARVGLTKPHQPWGCYVLQGPTGTGKTEFCKQLAKYLFGSEESMIKLDMAEFSEKHTVSRLIGAPPGYVGFDSAEPALTEQIRNKPYSVLLLDEIEKAHPDIFNVLLSILNDGKMQDNQGNVALFNNVIIVMTTNLGANDVTALLSGGKQTIGFGSASDKEKDPAGLEKELDVIYKKARMSYFKKPEMIGRIEALGGFVTFLPFTEEVTNKILDSEVKKLCDRFSSQDGAGMTDVTLVIGEEAKALIGKEGFSRELGARPLDSAIKTRLINPLGEWLLMNKDKIEQFVAENGPARLIVSSVEKMEPVLEKAPAPAALPAPTVAETAAASNDNGGTPSPQPKKDIGGGLKPF